MSDEWPRMYRAMLPEQASKPALVPAVGTEENMLGARVPIDVHPDEQGQVGPCGEGLSVGPNLMALPPGRVPARLRDKRRGARGNDDLCVFRLGMTNFRRAPLGNDLELIPTSNKHGVVQPIRRTLIDSYQQDLASTQLLWIVDEE